VRVVPGHAPGGKCPALNAAVAAADGEILVFSDARQRFAPDTVARLVGALRADGRLGAASGRLVLPRDAQSAVFQLYWRYERAIRAAEARLHSAVGVSGSVYAMPRALWAPMPAGLILDDLWAPMRLVLAGHRIGFLEDALAYETRRVNAGQEFTRKVRTLTGNFQLVAWLPGVVAPWRNPIWVQFVCHKLLRLQTPYAVLLIGAWLAWEGWRLAGPRAPLLLGVVAIGALWMLAGRDAIARRLRGIAAQVASLQAATVVACVNGVRGRWDVWKV
jgi:cellulose synthase/poly-beta-1,6-N-acetylglucosamine synthase-like glycosyltransferase